MYGITTPKLRIYTPVTHPQGELLVEEFTDYSRRYKQTTKMQGGFWVASWEIVADETTRANTSKLEQWYEEFLYYRMKAIIGNSSVWEGFIFEMTYSKNGFTEKKSLETTRNYVQTRFTDESGTEMESSWYSDTESEARYGRREHIINMREVKASEVDAMNAAYLRENAWPSSKVTRIQKTDGAKYPTLKVTAAGSIGYGNMRYQTSGGTIGTGTENASEKITDIINQDVPFWNIGRIDTNTTQVLIRHKDPPPKAYERIKEITEMGYQPGGGAPSEIWRFYVAEKQQAYYEKITQTPTYGWRHDLGITTIAGEQINPWTVQPAILRNQDRHGASAPKNQFVQQTNDLVIDEVEMAWGDEAPSIKTGEFSEEDLIRAAEKFDRWGEEEEEEGEVDVIDAKTGRKIGTRSTNKLNPYPRY